MKPSFGGPCFALEVGIRKKLLHNSGGSKKAVCPLRALVTNHEESFNSEISSNEVNYTA